MNKNVHFYLCLLLIAIGMLPAGRLAAQNPGYQWSLHIGATSTSNTAKAVARDIYGNTYVAGSLTGSNVDFDPSSATHALSPTGGTGTDVFVAKYNSAGQYQWAFNVGASGGGDVCNSIAVDSSGNVYITGVIASGGADFDPGSGTATLTSNGSNDIFVAKYNTDGQYQWAFNMGAGGTDAGTGITVDKNGNVYVTGSFSKTSTGSLAVNFDPSPGNSTPAISSTGGTDIFLAKYNTNGQYQWAFNIGSVSNEASTAVTTDVNGNVYLTGTFNNGCDFDPSSTGTSTPTSTGVADVFLAKYTSSGGFVWVRDIGNSAADIAGDIVTDASGNIYIVNDFQLSCIYSSTSTTTTITGFGNFDIGVAKYNSSGDVQWAFPIGGNGSGGDEGFGIDIDPNNNIYITGQLYKGNSPTLSVDFDPSSGTASLTSAGSVDVFVAKYSSSGAYQWAFLAGTTGGDVGNGIAVSGNNSFSIVGYFGNSSAINFDPSGNSAAFSSNGTQDMFVASYGDFRRWRGSTSTDWNTTSNWTTNTLPSTSDSVIIAAVTNNPVIGNSVSAAAKKLLIDSGASVTLSGTGTLAVGSGITVTPGGALVGNSSNTTGTVTLQQTVTGQRGWRVFANPFPAATTIATVASKNGIAIGTTVPSSGLTDSRTYSNSSDSWSNVTGATWASNTPYALFIRGLSSEVTGGNYTAGPSDFTYSVTGGLNSSSVAVTPTTANHFMLVGNPYAAPVTTSALTNGAGKPYYIYQVSKGANQTAQRTKAGGWIAQLSSSTTATIPVLSAIAYQPAATTSYNITASDINTGGTIQTGVFGAQEPIQYLELTINQQGLLQDKLFVRIGDQSNQLSKFVNDNVNLYTIDTDSNYWAIDARQQLKDSIAVGISAVAGDYQFSVGDNTLKQTIVYLKDNLLHTQTPLSKGTSYPFSITADAASKGEHRFELVFANTIPVVTVPAIPVTTGFTARLLGNLVNNTQSVKVEVSGSDHALLRITDATGKIIAMQNAINGINYTSIAGAAKGIYFVQVTDGTGASVVNKLVIE